MSDARYFTNHKQADNKQHQQQKIANIDSPTPPTCITRSTIPIY